MFVFCRRDSPIRSSVCSAGANRRYEIRRESPVIQHIVLFVFFRRESPIRSCLCSAGADRRFVFCDRSAVARRTSATTVTCTKWMRRRRSVGSSSRHSSDRVLVEQAGLRQGGGRSNLHCSDLSLRKSTRVLELWLPSWRYSQGDPRPPPRLLGDMQVTRAHFCEWFPEIPPEAEAMCSKQRTGSRPAAPVT